MYINKINLNICEITNSLKEESVFVRAHYIDLIKNFTKIVHIFVNITKNCLSNNAMSDNFAHLTLIYERIAKQYKFLAQFENLHNIERDNFINL